MPGKADDVFDEDGQDAELAMANKRTKNLTDNLYKVKLLY